MSQHRKSAWMIRGTLLIMASTVAGCASSPVANSSSAERATTSQLDGPISPSPPDVNVWHALRNTMADLHDAGFPIDYFFLFRVPVYVRTAP
jgi:hypothetical protein